jgi:hypothetical protein
MTRAVAGLPSAKSRLIVLGNLEKDRPDAAAGEKGEMLAQDEAPEPASTRLRLHRDGEDLRLVGGEA